MKKLFIVVDMQNDFVTGSLANKRAEEIVPQIVEAIRQQPSDCVFAHTCDTHDSTYLRTLEGQKLPVEHCIAGTEGWRYVPDIINALLERGTIGVTKNTFGAAWAEHPIIANNAWDEIELCGTCTDICVVSNALLLRAMFPDVRITVNSNLCAGTTPENHEAALAVMRSCQIDVI